jgi:hypothetical protein
LKTQVSGEPLAVAENIQYFLKYLIRSFGLAEWGASSTAIGACFAAHLVRSKWQTTFADWWQSSQSKDFNGWKELR